MSRPGTGKIIKLQEDTIVHGIWRDSVHLSIADLLADDWMVSGSECISFGADPDLKSGPLTVEDRGWKPE